MFCSVLQINTLSLKVFIIIILNLLIFISHIDWDEVYESWSYKNDWGGKDKKVNLLPSGPYY